VLPLRVRANPAVPLRLLPPVVDAEAPIVVAIGTAPGKEALVSQASVRYQLRARLLGDVDWLHDNPATAPELIATGDTRTDWVLQGASAAGNDKLITLPQSVGGEGILVGALARKEHRLSPAGADDPRTHVSEVGLRQAAVAFTRPDAKRQLLLRRETEGNCVWSFWGGQPGVVYSLRAQGADGTPAPVTGPVPIPETEAAAGGWRGIGRMRLARDLVVAATDGPPRTEFAPDPSRVKELQVWARFLRSGVEVALERPPLLVWVEPPAVCAGESAQVVVSLLQPAGQARLLQGDTLLREGAADAGGRLLLDTGPLPGASLLLLDAGVRCPLVIAQGVDTDLTLRVVNFQPLQAGAPAHLLDWGASAEVELATSQNDVTYTLINAADRTKPPREQQAFCQPLQGTGGPLQLRSDNLREDVDLLVRGTRLLDAAGLQQTTGYLSPVVPLRVRANAAMSVTLAEPVIDPNSPILVWIGDDAVPSSGSVAYGGWTLPLRPEDWVWKDVSATVGTVLLPSPPPADAPADAGWRQRDLPLPGTDGVRTQGCGGRLRLALGPAGGDCALALIANKEHRLFPFSSPDTTRVTTRVRLSTMVMQAVRPDPDRRLALVADACGWRLAGGEPGCAYSVLRKANGSPLGAPVSVPQRTSDTPPSDWGIGRLRVSVDLAVAGDTGPGLDRGPTLADLRAAVIRARRVFGGTTNWIRQAPLLVTQEPPPSGSNDTATLVVWGLPRGEQIRLRQPGAQGPSGDGTGDPVRLGTGPVPVNTEVTLEIRTAAGAMLWSLPVMVLPPGLSP